MSVEVLDDGRKRIEAPLSDEDVRRLEIGDVVLVRGTVYAARDAARKRMDQDARSRQGPPVRHRQSDRLLRRPHPERPGHVTGSAARPPRAGWTRWTPRLLELGLRGIMGKGVEGPAIRDELRNTPPSTWRRSEAGGVSALTVRSQEVIAFEDLDTEGDPPDGDRGLPVWVVTTARVATSTPRRSSRGGRTSRASRVPADPDRRVGGRERWRYAPVPPETERHLRSSSPTGASTTPLLHEAPARPEPLARVLAGAVLRAPRRTGLLTAPSRGSPVRAPSGIHIRADYFFFFARFGIVEQCRRSA